MKAITDYTPEEYKVMRDKYIELESKVKDTSYADWFTDFKRHSGYAHYSFSGDITGKLIELLGHEPTLDEIIMLVDDGFSHFGACCSITGRHFSGRVNTD